MVLDTTMRRWMKECSVETGDAGEYISSLCRSSGMSNEPHCLEILGLLETKNMFLTEAWSVLRIFSLFCLGVWRVLAMWASNVLGTG
jgi:hypothetical protein